MTLNGNTLLCFKSIPIQGQDAYAEECNSYIKLSGFDELHGIVDSYHRDIDVVENVIIGTEIKEANNSNAKSIDWSQFVPTLIATFIGFGLALFGSFLYDAIKEHNEKKIVIRNLRNELIEIQSEIAIIATALNNEDNNDVPLWIFPIKTYVWDSITTNKLELISEKLWYKELLCIYHGIHEYNTWHKIRTQSAINGLKYYLTEPSMKRVSEELNERITDILPKLI